MITQAERNAALVAAHNEALKIIAHMVPAMFMGYATAYIAAHPELIRDISDACLDAADQVRNQVKVNAPNPLVQQPLPKQT